MSKNEFLEIEKKYLIDLNLIDLSKYESIKIKQGYLKLENLIIEPRMFIQGKVKKYALYIRDKRIVLLKREISEKQFNALYLKADEKREYNFKKSSFDNLIAELIDAKKEFSMKNAFIFGTNYTVRVRTANDKAYLTIKNSGSGLTRFEFEIEFPYKEVLYVMKNKDLPLIEKIRYNVKYKGKIFEVDVFEGKNKGLVVAEVELDSEDEEVKLPDWIIKEVTDDKKYINACLIDNPYENWKTE